MLKKKKIVVAKVTRNEVETFKAFSLTYSGLLNAMSMLEAKRAEAWRNLIKDYKLKEGRNHAINHKTREISYDGFVEEKKK